MRATVSDFGPAAGEDPQANETQEGSLSLVFRYADEKGLPILDLADLRALLSFLDSDEGKADLKGIGGVSSATIGVLLRKLVQLEDGGGRVLRRAAAGHRRPPACRLRRPRDHLVPRAARRAGQAEAVLDRPHVAPRRAVRAAAGGRRRPEAEARVLLRRGASALRRCDGRLPRLGRADRPAHPFEGCRRLLHHADPKDIPQRAGPAGQPDSARAPRVHAAGREGAEGERLDLSGRRSSTTSRRSSRSSGPARQRSRSSPRRASRLPSCTRACAARSPAWSRPTTWTVQPRLRRSSPSTGRRPTARAPGAARDEDGAGGEDRTQAALLAAARPSRPSAVIRSPTSSAPRTGRGSSGRSFAACSACCESGCSGGSGRRAEAQRVADVPDQIVLSVARDREGKRDVLMRRVALGFLVAFLALGLLNVFGQRPATSTAENDARLEVYAPERVRGGLFYEARFRIDAIREVSGHARPRLRLGGGIRSTPSSRRRSARRAATAASPSSSAASRPGRSTFFSSSSR